jgi:transposase-like protein
MYLAGLRTIISEARIDLAESAGEVFPDADWQRCIVHFCRNVFFHSPTKKIRKVAAMLKAINAPDGWEVAETKAKDVIVKLQAIRRKAAAQLVETSIQYSSAYFDYTPNHCLKTNTKNQMGYLLE